MEHFGHHLRVGAATVPITPPVGTLLQGYGLRRAESVSDSLFASGLAVLHKDRLVWLLLSVDVIGVDRQFAARIRRSIAKRMPIDASQITIVCSHTHSGPATLKRLGSVPADRGYLKQLGQKLILVAEKASADCHRVQWRFGMTSLAENVNRRLRSADGVELGVDPTGPVDNRLRVLRFDRIGGHPQDNPLALIVHYACHATTRNGSEISADWPGEMRDRVGDFYESGGSRPVIHFLQGCTGNLTHRIGRDRNAWPEHFGRHTRVQSRVLGSAVAEAAIEASEQSLKFPVVEVRAGARAVALPFLDRGGLETSEIQLVRIGPSDGSGDSSRTLWFVGLPGEPFTEYSTDFGEAFQRKFGTSLDCTLICGYTNDCVGYLCTPQASREGGYEDTVANTVYHRPAPFSRDVESLLMDSALGVAEELLRGSPVEAPPHLMTSVRRFALRALRSSSRRETSS